MKTPTPTPQTKTYTLLLNLVGQYFAPQFNYDATSLEQAMSKAVGWAIYHSYDRRIVSTREATESDLRLEKHNEWVR